MDFKTHPSEYDSELNTAFPAKPYLEQFKDPKTDPTKSQTQFLQGFHSFYEKYVRGSSDSLSLLEFGGGPALFSLISASKYVERITFSDYAETNRDEVLRWRDKKSRCKLMPVVCGWVNSKLM